MNKLTSMLFRYLALIILPINNLSLFYLVFTPLTIYPSFVLISMFQEVALQGDTILASCGAVQIIDACVAGSAYYLLLILNLATPNLPAKKRALSILFSFSLLLLFNILRISVFALLFFKDIIIFDAIHLTTWYLFSTIFVFLIWLAEIRLFNIKEIPVYTDIIHLISLAKSRKK